MSEWYEDREELIAFVTAVARSGEWDIDSAVYCLEKPWKWTGEHEAWVTLGRPAKVEEIDDIDVSTWDARGRKRELERRYASVP